MSEITKYFYELMSDAMDVADCRTDAELENLLTANSSFDISRRSITQYHSGTVVPPFLKAKAILTVLGQQVDDDELLAVLDESRHNARQLKDTFGSGYDKDRRTIVLNYSNLLRGYQSFETIEILNNRIDELYGNEANFSAYVTSLIRKDLNEYIITKEEIEKEYDYE